MLYAKNLKMNKETLKSILKQIKNNEIDVETAVEKIGYGNTGHEFEIDFERKKRLGFQEIIYGKSKTIEQILEISKVYEVKQQNFFCTGLSEDKITELKKHLKGYEFVNKAGIIKHIIKPPKMYQGKVAVITAGTSDSKTAYEASETLYFLGIENKLFMDVGVAGIHRFYNKKHILEKYDVIIVIAGMEGALPSVVGGLFSQPVIAVPTSVGYGAALNGFTALMSMLTSCASGITVVNIDNGFGAAMAAFRIINKYQAPD